MDSTIKTFAREHPTMILTISYILVAAIGTGYSYFFYQEFGINIVKFADLSDFLLAAVLEPMSIILFIFLIVANLILYKLDFWARKKFPGYGRFTENRMKAKYTDPIGFIIIVLFFTGYLVKDIAQINANNVKTEKGDYYNVKTSNSSETEPEKRLNFLGSTTRFVYFYDSKKGKSLVIPTENIIYMDKELSIAKPKPIKATTKKSK
jgi:hypothetical protein